MRIALKNVFASLTIGQSARGKASSATFFDELARTSCDTTPALPGVGCVTQEQPGTDSDSKDKSREDDAGHSLFQKGAAKGPLAVTHRTLSIDAPIIQANALELVIKAPANSSTSDQPDTVTRSQGQKGKIVSSDDNQGPKLVERYSDAAATLQLPGQLASQLLPENFYGSSTTEIGATSPCASNTSKLSLPSEVLNPPGGDQSSNPRAASPRPANASKLSLPDEVINPVSDDQRSNTSAASPRPVNTSELLPPDERALGSSFEGGVHRVGSNGLLGDEVINPPSDDQPSIPRTASANIAALSTSDELTNPPKVDHRSNPAEGISGQAEKLQIAGRISAAFLMEIFPRHSAAGDSTTQAQPIDPSVASASSQSAATPTPVDGEQTQSEVAHPAGAAGVKPTGPQDSAIAIPDPAQILLRGNFAQSATVAKSDPEAGVKETTQLNGGGASAAMDSMNGLTGTISRVSQGTTNEPKNVVQHDAIQHVVPSANQLPGHAQSSNSSDPATQAKPIEGGSTQVVVALPTHSGSAMQSQPSVSSATSHELPLSNRNIGETLPDQVENARAAGGAGINAARLIQTMSASEFRIGMHSAEFGTIAIRTSLTQQDVQAQINVDHPILGSAIEAHIPSLQSKLGSEFGLNASIEVNQQGNLFGGGQSQSSQQEHKLFTPSVPAPDLKQSIEPDLNSLPPALLANQDSRLDVQA